MNCVLFNFVPSEHEASLYLIENLMDEWSRGRKNRANCECCSILWQSQNERARKGLRKYLIRFPCFANDTTGTQMAKGTCPRWHISIASKSPDPSPQSDLVTALSTPNPPGVLEFSKNLENQCAVLLILVYLHMWLCALVLRIEDIKIVLSAVLSVQNIEAEMERVPSERMSLHQTLVLKPPESWGVSREKLFFEESFFMFLKVGWVCIKAWVAVPQCLANGGLWPKDRRLQLWDRWAAWGR